ncbi:MAG: hypothetical protein H6667_16260 [Ardenticatenaceae bacterium]|nr:hypothetical protein [Ardenticatenaceae bacterium]MCB9443612.1 hypothetical protein [Ardenticatenaceae bacterium]
MKHNKLTLIILMTLFILPALACGGISVPKVDELAGQAADAATKAAEAAATAVIVAQQVASSEQVQSLEATAVAAATSLANTNIELPENSSLRQKFSNAQPDANGNITITVTDAEMNEAIQMKQAAAEQAGQEQPLQGTMVTFTGGNIVLTGSIATPITAQLTATFRPYVANGILQFEVVSASLGSINVPTALLSASQATLNSTLNEAMGNLPANYTLQDVLMGEGTMTIYAHKQ